MITGDGGFVHRMMPPVDWNCGTIPEKCYDASLSRRKLRDILRATYLMPENIQRLAGCKEE